MVKSTNEEIPGYSFTKALKQNIRLRNHFGYYKCFNSRLMSKYLRQHLIEKEQSI